MSIFFDEKERVFCLDTPNSSYRMGVWGKDGVLVHLYFGRRIDDADLWSVLPLSEKDLPSANPGQTLDFWDSVPQEYSGFGRGDMREACLAVEAPDGSVSADLSAAGYRIFSGKPKIPGLPASYGSEEDCETLEIGLVDSVLGIRVSLFYTLFEGLDCICRSARVTNAGKKTLKLRRALSSSLDMMSDGRDFDTLTLHGAWSAERMIDRTPLGMGRKLVSSRRGVSSHQEQPFMALLERSANQTSGEVYGHMLVYSGNFIAQTEMDYAGRIRTVIGISPESFCWSLPAGETFYTPEAILVYSGSGLDGMTHTYHDLIREHIVRGAYKDQPRPSLVNNWEATYFDFNTEKLLTLADEAARRGIEMLVLDDGWFGHRDDDHTSLGDWYVYESKLAGGLRYLSDEIHNRGLKFGLWFEPEMVSEDSDLFRAHSEYILAQVSRVPAQHRNQYVLDMSRAEVRDAVYTQMKAVLDSTQVDYIKWDMNRTLTDVFSLELPAGRQGEVFHRYVLGVYELQERLLTDYPKLLLENCSSGGARFDAGMLYYSPQIWTSDNTEAIERLRIQEGTALIYPFSSMGAHVAACPSHTNHRVTPFATRGLVALAGCFGYELDLTKLPEEELAQIPDQLALYRDLGPIFRAGDYYRLASYQENGEYDAYMAVSKDRSRAAAIYTEVQSRSRKSPVRLYFRGLDPKGKYELFGDVENAGEVHTGACWMNAGLLLPRLEHDYSALCVTLEKIPEQEA